MTDLPLTRSTDVFELANRPAIILCALCAVLLAAFIPTGLALANGPWQTEQEGHGPFILAIALWIVWRKRDELKAASFTPSFLLAWALILGGAGLLFLGRSQEILWIETFSLPWLLAGVVLMTGGWKALRILAFPIGILFFAVPPPGWLLDALTLPLKSAISDVVTRLLYALGFPIAQNGVVIMIGPYQLLVKDACAGMNSIFALSAIGLIYLYLMEYKSRTRNIILLLSILPITIAANFVRVLALVLIAYYYGSASIEGFIHDMTGLALFVVAFVIMVMVDAVLGALLALGRLSRRNSVSSSKSVASS